MENLNDPNTLSAKQKIISYLILISVSAYWATTFFFNLPSNYLSVNSLKENKYYDLVFFQRWGFFAPPPNFNERLYYTFFDINKRTVGSFEVLENIFHRKQMSVPFNKREEIEDYIVSNTISTLMDYSRNIQDILRYENHQKNKSSFDSSDEKLIVAEIEGRPEFLTLYNYGVLLKQNKGLTNSAVSCQIKITRVSIPQFEDRLKEGKEELVFSSNVKRL